MQQPEAKLKAALGDGFEEAFGPKSKHAFWSYMKGHKDGIPDLFFAALGRSVWIEVKVDDNDLEKSQSVTIARMVAGGAVVLLLTGSHLHYRRKDRPFLVQSLTLHASPWVETGWHVFSLSSFWQRVLESK
jgi:hypothetical protein